MREIARLLQEGTQKLERSELLEALTIFQQVLAIAREIGDKVKEGEALHKIGVVYYRLKQYPQALKSYQQALTIRQQIGDRAAQGNTLYNIGGVCYYLSKYAQALEFLQQALAVRRVVGDRLGVGRTLNYIGLTYYQLSQYDRSLEFLNDALTISQEIKDKAGEGNALNNIGLVYDKWGKYPRALEFYQQALAILKLSNSYTEEANTLNNIGIIYRKLGQYNLAVEFYQQALAVYQKVNDRSGIGSTFNNVGFTYEKLIQYSRALDYYQKSLAVSREIGDRVNEANTLNNLGLLYNRLGKSPQALEYLKQALAIFRELKQRADIGKVLDSIGTVYKGQSQYLQALESYHEALAIRQEVGDKAGIQVTLSNIGDLLAQQKKSELAIAFYKQSVNVTEEIRRELRSLPKEQQQSYTNTIADTYRRLADLLLQQDRVLEAQQVLDLLKVQEIDDYLRNVRGNDQTARGVDLLPQEQQLKEGYNAILNKEIQLGRELADLQKIPIVNQTPAQQKRIAELEQIQRKIRAQFNDFIRSPEVVALVEQLSRREQPENLNLQQLNRLRDNLQRLEQNAVLLYPLILEDRLELILITPDTPPIHRPVTVKREELNRAILEFRTALEKPDRDAKAPATKLYNWLIKPIENDLKQAEAKTIIYAPDGQLRYIPLAALYDGKQWLVQRFRINNITAMSLDELDTKPLNQPQILAAAFATGRHNFKVGQYRYAFSGLPFAGVEVESLVSMIPGTKKLLDGEFSREATIPQLGNYNIVHLATHAIFVTGQPEDSFILLGDGARITLRDIETWSLPNVDLVVLSACQTAIGGKLGNGEEILGFGYQMQETGARAAIASLWSVNDGGTQALMDGFYRALQQGKITKAEALRRAQVALIASNKIPPQTLAKLPAAVADRLNHPYYWAPFILVGNGL